MSKNEQAIENFVPQNEYIINHEQGPIEENIFDHVLYEFEMFLFAFYGTLPASQYYVNLIVEGRMVHLRNLAYFFLSKENKKSKRFMKYKDFFNITLDDEIDSDLFDNIERITSNSTLHMLRGRIKPDFKQETSEETVKIAPRMLVLIKEFIDKADGSLRKEYISQWNEKRIRERVQVIRSIIKTIEE